MMHKHHIIPKHMGGKDDSNNIIELTIEEHADAHRQLFEKYGKWEDKLAWKMLSGQITASEASKEAKRIGCILGGKIQGKRSVESGLLERIRTKESQISGGKARFEKHGHIHKNMSVESTERYLAGRSKGGKIGGPKGAATTNSIKVLCCECGFISSVKGIKYHLKKTNHVKTERI